MVGVRGFEPPPPPRLNGVDHNLQGHPWLYLPGKRELSCFHLGGKMGGKLWEIS